MVLSYARGSWRFKVASLVASSVAVAVRYGNVGGSFSGNEELVASLMAECDGKNGGNRILVAKGVATLHGKNWTGSLAITFWRQQRRQKLMAAFWAEKVANTFSHKKALSVHGTCWQKGCERLFGGKWGVKLMAKVLAKFGATSIIESWQKSCQPYCTFSGGDTHRPYE